MSKSLNFLFLLLVFPGLVWAQQAKPVDMPGVPVQAIDPRPKKVVESAPKKEKLQTSKLEAKEIKPLELSLKVGDSKMIYISKGMLNPIQTPFEHPVAKTVNKIEMFKEGSSIYIATGEASAISVIFSDKRNPEATFTLTMIPVNIPPRQINVSLNGQGATRHYNRESEVLQGQPYVTYLSGVLKSIASGEVPNGYSLSNVRQEFTCQTRLDTRASQLIEGTRYTVLVLAAINQTSDEIQFDESDCFRDDVAAVAAWPNVHLSPGEQTEIYVVLSNTPKGSRVRLRPSTLDREG